MSADRIVARYNFEEPAQKAALARTIETGVPHYYRADGSTFVVYTNAEAQA